MADSNAPLRERTYRECPACGHKMVTVIDARLGSHSTPAGAWCPASGCTVKAGA